MALEKAVVTNTATGERISVMFNPEEYSLSRENNFAQIAVPGLSAPIIQFSHGNQQSLEMELFLDTYEAHREGSRQVAAAGEDVRKHVRKITDLMNIQPATHAPPVLLFTWGSLAFTCVLTRATQKFIMFLPDGTPVRARVQVSFGQYSNAELEAKEVKRETADYSKYHIVKPGEKMTAIAATAYGDPRLWRAIALRNNVADPRALEAGQRLAIPSLPYRDPSTGEVFQ
ncbi:MAG: LysM peptidoglycan-binding domain-containing protein [Rhizobacter sp.]